jgi:FMN phosphatase YigB (HAD superfamily)
MADISAVIFDLGKVLVDWDISQGIWAEVIETIGPQAEDTPLRRDWQQVYRSYSTGRMPPDVFHREVCRITGLQMSYKEFVPNWCDIFFTMPGAEELFHQLIDRFPVGLLSDTDPLHWDYLLSTWPWLKKIPNPTLSFKIGFTKPAPDAYLAAARNTGFPPQACFFTDDRPKNITGAREVGMDAELFTDVAALRSQLEARGILK